jgi:NIMA (never in mitosis gene a)-related kinase
MKRYMISDNFIILKTIGKGAFSSVYKVRRVETDKIYALKKVPLSKLKEKEIENALNEI